MTIQEFNLLNDQRKKEIIIDAHKVAEYQDDHSSRFELFHFEDFYIEVKVNFQHRYRKIINTYSFQDIPLIYGGKELELLS